MLIKPRGMSRDAKPYQDDSDWEDLMFYETGIYLNPDEVNLNFRKYYESYVFCTKNQLSKIKEAKVDVIIFTGYAGAGHFAPSRALAKKYADKGKNVIIVDLLHMVSPLMSFINVNSWLYVSRYNQDLFVKSTEMVGSEKGSDDAFGIFKKMNIDFLINFIKSKKVNVCISTYLSANLIASKIADHVNMFGVLLPDVSSIAMSCELYKDTENIVYFTINEETALDAKRRYPYHINTKKFVTIGAVPTFIQKRYEQDIYRNTLTWIVGGGMGIGYGIEALDTVIKSHDGPIIIVCGDNQNWYRKVLKAMNKYLEKKIFAFKYVSPENIKTLMQNSKIIIGKPGGSTFSEMISMEGYKIFYGTIKGHEENNARYCEELGLVRWCKNIDELAEEIKNPIFTKSIYSKDILKKNPADFIVDYTAEYID